MEINKELYLRITVGKREFVLGEVKREPSNERDKWNTFLAMLLESFKGEKYFPYTVELKPKSRDIYGNVSFEIPTPAASLTRKYGVIAIDTNASPLHLAIAEVGDDGNLLSYQSISLHEFLNYPQNTKDHKEWLLAHEIVDIATQKGKAIAIENLKKVNKDFRGDRKAKLRKRLRLTLGFLGGLLWRWKSKAEKKTALLEF